MLIKGNLDGGIWYSLSLKLFQGKLFFKNVGFMFIEM